MGMAPEVVVIDCAGHMLGRLASIIAKQLLHGQKVVAVMTEKICVPGGFVRQKMKYERFRRKRHLTNPKKGPYHYKAPSKILWRTIRGMAPHKTHRGAEALGRFQFSRESQPHMTRPRESLSLTHSRSSDCSTDTSMSSSATSLPPSVGSTAALSRS